MTIFKTLIRSLTSSSSSKATTTRTFLTTPIPPFPLTHLLHHHQPLSPSFSLRWAFSCFQGGPLFLSSPPYKLSQSATPLTCRHAAVLRNLEDLVAVGRTRKGPVEEREGGAFGPASVREETGPVGAEAGILRSFVNWPNLISVSRLVSGPFIGWMITSEMYSSAFVGLAISGATDWLDGYVARKMGINSVVGSYLDPLADKVLIGSVAVAMVHMDLLHPGLVGLVILRDVALVGGAVYHRARSLGWKWNSWYDFVNLDGTRPEKVEPLFISKVNTVFQLVLVAAALLQPEFGSPETQPCITYLSWLVASTTVASTAAYGAQYMGNRSLLLAKK